MKTTSYALALAASIASANAYWSGFNVQSTLADGSCKTQADWEKDFNTMKALPGARTSMRVYASSDCNTLVNAVPAALATGGQILVGVWTEDSAHFEAEKQALLSAVQTYGFDWIVAVSVGSEDLYRGDTTASTLAQQIYDVRGMLSTVSGYSTSIQVGHVDTWTAWVDGWLSIFPEYGGKRHRCVIQLVLGVRPSCSRCGQQRTLWYLGLGHRVWMAYIWSYREPSCCQRGECPAVLVDGCVLGFQLWTHFLVLASGL